MRKQWNLRLNGEIVTLIFAPKWPKIGRSATISISTSVTVALNEIFFFFAVVVAADDVFPCCCWSCCCCNCGDSENTAFLSLHSFLLRVPWFSQNFYRIFSLVSEWSCSI